MDKKYVVKLCFLGLLYLASSSILKAQYYGFCGFSHGFASNWDILNGSIVDFNENQNHTLEPFKSISGYQFGFGKYGPFSMVELAYGNMGRKQKSNNPNQLNENADVIINFTAVSFNLGLRPFSKTYFVIGAGMNLGHSRLRYSFGGDYQMPVSEYLFHGNIFVEYAFKVRFLIRKSLRDKLFYLLRMRPYYQLQFPLDLEPFGTTFGSGPSVGDDFMESFSHFGFQISFIIPFVKNSSDK